MDPRLRSAVDASRRWYDDVFALCDVPVRVTDGLWSALAPGPPWHSVAKTLEPGIETRRVMEVVAAFEHCAVADSFGDLAPDGFDLLIEARWVHRDARRGAGHGLPDGWSLVTTAEDLAEWTTAHDYTDVLPASVLDHPRFRILARHRDGALVGGAVMHDGGDAVGLSNAWGEAEVAMSDQVLEAVAALHPGRAVVDYAEGAELEAMLAAGFTAVGPQRVWTR